MIKFTQAIAVFAMTVCTAGNAATIHVAMRNKGSEGAMVFEPSYVRANVGDVIVFDPADKGHNAQAIPGMVPDGGQVLSGAMSQPATLTLSKAGLYGIRCFPHFGLGMVALIKAGKGVPSNLQAVQGAVGKVPPMAAKRLKPLIESASK